MSDKAYNTAIGDVDARWGQINARFVDEAGRRVVAASRRQAFLAAQRTVQRLGMVIEDQNYDSGFLLVSSPAPTPLTGAEWERVRKADTPELRAIIAKTVGPASWFVTLDPTAKDVLANVLVTDTRKGVEVSLGIRLRDRKVVTGRIRRTQAPPTAVRIGFGKFWSTFEKELRIVVAESPARTAGLDGALAGTRAGETPTARGASATRPDAIAVIIGNKAYGSGVPHVDYAHNDAEAMKRFLVQVQGFREGNIIDLRDATQADMTAAFGNERTHQGKLWRWVRPGESDVVVYYSGHGVTGLKDGLGYLLPVNAAPDAPEINGYPINLLYGNLARLKVRSLTVFLDACFSGETPRGMLIRSASGIGVAPRFPGNGTISFITAAQGNQVASWDEEARQGLFTRYLLEAMRGAADSPRYGNGDGDITMGEVKDYLDREMTYAARRRYGREQTASIQGDPSKVLVSASNIAPRPRADIR